MTRKTVTVDVREDIRRGREPFGRIMQAVTTLNENEAVLLIAPFEPKPLYGVLAQRGFAHQSKATPAGDWEVLFTREGADRAQSAASVTEPSKPSYQTCSGTPIINIDARGLEPPQPLVKILEALASLPQGARLRAHTDRRPMHLYAHLEERGFTGQTEEQPDGTFITHVSRQ